MSATHLLWICVISNLSIMARRRCVCVCGVSFARYSTRAMQSFHWNCNVCRMVRCLLLPMMIIYRTWKWTKKACIWNINQSRCTRLLACTHTNENVYHNFWRQITWQPPMGLHHCMTGRSLQAIGANLWIFVRFSLFLCWFSMCFSGKMRKFC